MRLFAIALLSSFAFACSAAPGADEPGLAEAELSSENATFKNYRKSDAWGSSCDGETLAQSDLKAMLGDETSKVLGRFQVAMRDLCSPWVNGLQSCGPSGETRAAWTGDATFALAIDPQRSSVASWRFLYGPLLVRDEGVVLARLVGNRVVVQLVGDLSSTEIGTARQMDGTVTGRERLRGRILSSDLLSHAGQVRGGIRVAIGSDDAKLDAADIDVDRLRWSSPPSPIANVSLATRAFGRVSFSDSLMWTLQGNLTASCLRLTDGLTTPRMVVTATFDVPAPAEAAP